MSLFAHFTFNEIAGALGIYMLGLGSGLLVARQMIAKRVEDRR